MAEPEQETGESCTGLIVNRLRHILLRRVIDSDHPLFQECEGVYAGFSTLDPDIDEDRRDALFHKREVIAPNENALLGKWVRAQSESRLAGRTLNGCPKRRMFRSIGNHVAHWRERRDRVHVD